MLWRGWAIFLTLNLCNDVLIYKPSVYGQIECPTCDSHGLFLKKAAARLASVVNVLYHESPPLCHD